MSGTVFSPKISIYDLFQYRKVVLYLVLHDILQYRIKVPVSLDIANKFCDVDAHL
jgi:hypothetical protein